MNQKIRIASQIMLMAVFTLVIFSCAGPEAKKAKYIANAKQFMKDSNWPKARVSLRNVLKIDPKDPDAYFLFGQVEEKEGNWKNAFGNYLKTVELKPDYREALVQIGRYYLIARDDERVLETADKILRYYRGDPSAVTLKSSVLSYKGRRKEAMALAEESIKTHPTAPDLVSFLSSLYFVEGKKSEGERLLKQALEADPGNVILLDNYADYLAGQGDFPATVTVLKKLVEAQPKVLNHRVQLALYYDKNHRPEEAEATLRESVRLEPDNEERRLVLAEFLNYHEKFKEEEAWFLESVSQLPKSTRIRFALGEFYERRHELPGARKIYEEIYKLAKTPASSEEAEARLAAMDLGENKRDSAEVRLNEILKRNPNSSVALLVKGKIAKGKGDFKEAIQDFRTILRDQPDRADVQTLLGESYLLNGDTALARESFDKSLTLKPIQKEAKKDLIRVEMAEQHQKAARAKIDDLLRENPADQEVLSILLGLQIDSGEWEGSEKTLAQLRKNGGDPYSLDMAEGAMYQKRKEWKKAESAYEKAMIIQPEAEEPLGLLVKMELKQGRGKEAINRLEKVSAEYPKKSLPHELIGQILLSDKNEPDAEKEFAKAAELKPDWVKPWTDLATLKIAQKRAADALRILETGVKANPKAEKLYLLKAATLESLGETDRAIKDYEYIVKENPKDIIAVNNLAMLLTDKKGDPQSLERALTLSKDFETARPDPVFLDTLGWIYVKLGRGEDGVRVLKNAILKYPKEPSVNYHLGMAYYKTGKIRDARNYLTRAVLSGAPFAGSKEARETLNLIKG